MRINRIRQIIREEITRAFLEVAGGDIDTKKDIEAEIVALSAQEKETGTKDPAQANVQRAQMAMLQKKLSNITK
jgi:translation elongation factor EF-Tu-like GTPase